EIAGHLCEAYPDLDPVGAGALVGAFVGATAGALQVLLDEPGALDGDPAVLRERLEAALATALRPWAKAE
ncbi:MAG TPA: TetR/AcrR family transcriptional regulator, partial [Phytomonospora sp.]